MPGDGSDQRATAPVAIGCLGARDLPPDAAAACRKVAADLARGGYALVTGAPPGAPGRDAWADWADAAFAYGAERANPTCLTVCLPWRHFPQGSASPPLSIQTRYPDDHPAWTTAAAHFWTRTHNPAAGDWAEAVPRAPRLRHTRNVGIVLAARMLLVWPDAADEETRDEETRFALAFAEWSGTPTLDLSQTAWWTVAPTLVERLRFATAEHA